MEIQFPQEKQSKVEALVQPDMTQHPSLQSLGLTGVGGVLLH